MADKGLDAIRAEGITGAERLRALYAARFAGDPEGELCAWLHVVARREAALIDVQRQILSRPVLRRSPTVPGKIAREALLLIVKRERLHLTFIEERLAGYSGLRPFAVELMIWLGGLENALLAPLAQRAATEDRAGALFSLCSTLAGIVRRAYARLEELARALRDRSVNGRGADGLARELGVKHAEELFHEQVFGEMAGWMSPPKGGQPKSTRDCAQRLARLLPTTTVVADAGAARAIIDGGIGKLFARHRIALS